MPSSTFSATRHGYRSAPRRMRWCCCCTGDCGRPFSSGVDRSTVELFLALRHSIVVATVAQPITATGASIRSMAVETIAVLEHLDRPAHLVGHGGGAMWNCRHDAAT